MNPKIQGEPRMRSQTSRGAKPTNPHEVRSQPMGCEEAKPPQRFVDWTRLTHCVRGLTARYEIRQAKRLNEIGFRN